MNGGVELAVILKLAGGPQGEPCQACQMRAELSKEDDGEASLKAKAEYLELSKCNP